MMRIDIIIRHPLLLLRLLAALAGLRIAGAGQVFVLVVGLRVEGDDVPGVQQAGDVAEHQEEDVDERVGGADARFDPDGDRGEEDGEDGEEAVRGAHFSFSLSLFF